MPTIEVMLNTLIFVFVLIMLIKTYPSQSIKIAFMIGFFFALPIFGFA